MFKLEPSQKNVLEFNRAQLITFEFDQGVYSMKKWVLIKLVFIAAITPLFYGGCSQSGLAPTSANSGVNSNAAATLGSPATPATAGGAWVNTAFPAQTGDFTVTFDASVSAAPTNAIIALSNGAQTAYASFANLVRFNTTGVIDAYNGSIPGYA